MAKTKFELPDMSNATPSMLIDEMGKMSMVENYAKKARAAYKETFFAMTGINPDDVYSEPIVHKGETFVATVTQSYPTRLDQTKVREEHPEVYEECLKTNSQLTTRFTLAEGVDNPVVGDLIEQIKRELDLE